MRHTEPPSTLSSAGDTGHAFADRQFDIVLYGATGFVGRLAADHLVKYAYGARIGLAGRDAQKLAAVRLHLGVEWPILVSDLTNDADVQQLASSARVVASTIGRHSLPIALACARAGTSYADLSGETPFVRRSIDQVHDIAVSTGARIVHACGVNAVPSDLGTFQLAERVSQDGHGKLTDTILIIAAFKGGFSGGNLDSNQAQSAALRANRQLQHAIADPWILAATPRRTTPHDADPAGAFRDDLTGQWLAPSLGGPFNSRFVRRSASLINDDGYGPDFHYREATGVGTSVLARVRANAVATGISVLQFALTSSAARPVMNRLVPPGSGPSEKTRRNGRFRVEIHTRTSTGKRYVAEVAFAGDPGYSATSVMLAQAALSLSADSLTSTGGVLTPATAMGHHLVDRLVRQGFVIDVRGPE